LTFDWLAILVFGLAAFPYAGLLPARYRGWALMLGSVVAIFWLQPALPVRFAAFVLPAATVALVVAGWAFTRRPDDPRQQATAGEDRLALTLILLLIVALSLFRYVDADWRLTAARPPAPLTVALGLVAAAGLTFGLARVGRGRRGQLAALTAFIAILFVLLKSPPAAAAAGRVWRGLAAQDVTLASPADLGWLGFSFVAFRLIHTLRDRQMGILPILSLREYVTYAIFFPAYTAGPIDRAERFVEAYRDLPTLAGLDAGRFAAGLERIFVGLVKKFVIADLLAQGLALNATNAGQATSPAGLWLLLYGYAFRLFFDFAGYTDIAIGLGLLFGIRLPENFDRPYLRANITAFWQSWHMTLSNWARFYVFSPLSRRLLTRGRRLPAVVVVLLAQLATMAVIGLWHGITWPFLIWGLWHGLGLFAHKLWSDRTRRWYRELSARPARRRGWAFVGWFLTFHFVTLSWVWFALPDVEVVMKTLGRLFGLGW
jgi:D-alanyl-lipoteichoic acid acyltransferase DltB (MBOAT superfamily)